MDKRKCKNLLDLFVTIAVLVFFISCSGEGGSSSFKTKYTKDDFFRAIELGDVQVVDNCIKQGMNVNEPRVQYGKLPLSIGVITLNVDIVKLLMDAGADSTLSLPRSSEGQTGVVMGTWPSPIVLAEGLKMAAQLTGDFSAFYHMTDELELTKKVADPLQDPKFNEKIEAIYQLLTKSPPKAESDK